MIINIIIIVIILTMIMIIMTLTLTITIIIRRRMCRPRGSGRRARDEAAGLDKGLLGALQIAVVAAAEADDGLLSTSDPIGCQSDPNLSKHILPCHIPSISPSVHQSIGPVVH